MLRIDHIFHKTVVFFVVDNRRFLIMSHIRNFSLLNLPELMGKTKLVFLENGLLKRIPNGRGCVQAVLSIINLRLLLIPPLSLQLAPLFLR